MDDMNDTQQAPPQGSGPEDAAGTDPGFDSTRLRTITDMHRSRSDALLGGVCTGAARYLNIDPVIIRIAFVVLTFIGGAGVILYVAAWFFLPVEADAQGQAGPSVAADWFNLEGNEERVRVGGMITAAVIAALAVVGDSGWGWGFPWWLFPIGLVLFFAVFLPNRRRRRYAAAAGFVPADYPGTGYRDPSVDALIQAKTDQILAKKIARAREPRSGALFGLTVSIVAIAMAITRLVSDANGGTGWTTYVAIALAIVGLAVVVSSFIGDGGALIFVGLLLAPVLAFGSLLPDARIGQQTVDPVTAAEVASSYKHGIGQLELDLTEVGNPNALLGRTITIDSGVGQTRVILPSDLDVAVNTELRAGEIRLFDRQTDGTSVELSQPAKGARHLTIDINHRLGNIEVIRK